MKRTRSNSDVPKKRTVNTSATLALDLAEGRVSLNDLPEVDRSAFSAGRGSRERRVPTKLTQGNYVEYNGIGRKGNSGALRFDEDRSLHSSSSISSSSSESDRESVGGGDIIEKESDHLDTEKEVNSDEFSHLDQRFDISTEQIVSENMEKPNKVINEPSLPFIELSSLENQLNELKQPELSSYSEFSDKRSAPRVATTLNKDTLRAQNSAPPRKTYNVSGAQKNLIVKEYKATNEFHKKQYANSVGLPPNVINGWARSISKFGEFGGRRRHRHKRIRAAWEFELYEWFRSMRASYAPMTMAAVAEKAKGIAGNRVSSDFKFSPSWFYGFCKFFRISCRIAAEASGSERLDIDELHHRLEVFFARQAIRFAAMERVFLDVKPLVVSVDQMPLMLRTTPIFTFASMFEKRAMVCNDAPSKARVTATIGFTHAGTTIRPEINLKSGGAPGSQVSFDRIVRPLIDRFGHKAAFALTKKAWATQASVKAYLIREIFPLARKHGLVVLYIDAFSGHFYNNKTKEFDYEFISFCAANGVFVRYLPGGSTPFLQVGDTHIHRLLKAYIASRWAMMSLARLEKIAEMNRTQAADIDDAEVAIDEENARTWIAGALLDALFAVPEDLIRRAFVDNGILGGSIEKITGQLFNFKSEGTSS